MVGGSKGCLDGGGLCGGDPCGGGTGGGGPTCGSVSDMPPATTIRFSYLNEQKAHLIRNLIKQKVNQAKISFFKIFFSYVQNLHHELGKYRATHNPQYI